MSREGREEERKRGRIIACQSSFPLFLSLRRCSIYHERLSHLFSYWRNISSLPFPYLLELPSCPGQAYYHNLGKYLSINYSSQKFWKIERNYLAFHPRKVFTKKKLAPPSLVYSLSFYSSGPSPFLPFSLFLPFFLLPNVRTHLSQCWPYVQRKKESSCRNDLIGCRFGDSRSSFLPFFPLPLSSDDFYFACLSSLFTLDVSIVMVTGISPFYSL